KFAATGTPLWYSLILLYQPATTFQEIHGASTRLESKFDRSRILRSSENVSARTRARLPIEERSSSFVSKAIIASASFVASAGGTRKPQSPSTTIPCSPPT